MFSAEIQDYHDKVSYMCELVKSLPPANHDTMELLFRHLRRYAPLTITIVLYNNTSDHNHCAI